MEHCQKTLEIDPNVFQAHAYLAMIHRRNERFEEALSEWQKLITSFGRPSLARAMRRTYGESGFGAALAQLAGSVARAAYLLQALSYLPLRTPRRITPILVAMLDTEAEEKDRAIRWLRKVCIEGEPQVIALGFNPHWDGLRSDPSFQDMVQRTRLAAVPSESR